MWDCSVNVLYLFDSEVSHFSASLTKRSCPPPVPAFSVCLSIPILTLPSPRSSSLLPLLSGAPAYPPPSSGRGLLSERRHSLHVLDLQSQQHLHQQRGSGVVRLGVGRAATNRLSGRVHGYGRGCGHWSILVSGLL